MTQSGPRAAFKYDGLAIKALVPSERNALPSNTHTMFTLLCFVMP
jgi:hypothetical protein